MAQRAMISKAAYEANEWASQFDWLLRVFLIVAAVMVLVQAAERHPPFELVKSFPSEARAGGNLKLVADVRRDVARECSVEVERYIVDGAGVRFAATKDTMSADALRAVEARSPGQLRISLDVPPTAAPGPAAYIGVLRYRCNQIHALWPIEVTTALPFTVLP